MRRGYDFSIPFPFLLLFSLFPLASPAAGVPRLAAPAAEQVCSAPLTTSAVPSSALSTLTSQSTTSRRGVKSPYTRSQTRRSLEDSEQPDTPFTFEVRTCAIAAAAPLTAACRALSSVLRVCLRRCL